MSATNQCIYTLIISLMLIHARKSITNTDNLPVVKLYNQLYISKKHPKHQSILKLGSAQQNESYVDTC